LLAPFVPTHGSQRRFRGSLLRRLAGNVPHLVQHCQDRRKLYAVLLAVPATGLVDRLEAAWMATTRGVHTEERIVAYVNLVGRVQVVGELPKRVWRLRVNQHGAAQRLSEFAVDTGDPHP